ncbi:hypothetical protein ECPA3_2138, partial [Escherichia coli PA3]
MVYPLVCLQLPYACANAISS